MNAVSHEDKTVVWTFVGSLITVKLVTSVVILYYFPSWHTLLLVGALSVAWFLPPVMYLMSKSPGRYRLLRARARRRELVRQEWNVEERTPSNRM
jgi:hypothetical protein